MKKILIVNNNMHIGGVQRALLNLLKEIESVYDVTLLLFYKGGELLSQVPENVKVITSDTVFRCWGMDKNDALKLKGFVIRSFWAAATRILGRKWAICMQIPFQKKIRGYDVAVSFLHSGAPHMFYGGCNEFVMYCVDAKKKITFLHCDYGKINADSRYNTKLYQKFDMIAAPSAGCREAFLSVLPQFAEKTAIVRNCHDYAGVRRMAQKENIIFDSGKLNIVTVSRFGKEKGVLRGIRAIDKLGVKRKFISYYIIGDGFEFEKAKSLISQLGLADTVFLPGETVNPYGYIRAADLLLIPSVSEAAPMVIGEAVGLGIPVLTTATSSADEMVVRTGFGWVCDNSVDGIKDAIGMLLIDPEKIKARKDFIKSLKFDNETAVKQFSALMF